MATLKKSLKGLTKKQLSLVPKSFDTIGEIAVFSDFPEELEKKEKLIAETLMKINKNIKTVAKKTKEHYGLYRTRKVKIIAGKRRKTTIHKENRAAVKLNIETCYFSPRLSTERERIAKLVKPNESILVMFSGISIYPLVIAKNSKPKEIYAVEINPHAHKFAEENIKLNKTKNIFLFKGDARKAVPKLKKKFDRILMPLPKSAGDFLDMAKLASKKTTLIHFYDFLREDEIKKSKEKIKKQFPKARFLRTVKCGNISPGKYRICLDFKVG